MKIGVAGLGSMGYGIAASLLRAGHQVCGADVNPDAVTRLQADGAVSDGIGTAAPGLDALVVVVLNAAQTEAVLFGADGIAPKLTRGAVVICCVTVAPDFARSMAARCDTLGLHYLDAARPMLNATAEKVFELGDSAGMGSAMKAVNQMLAGTHIAAMAEALTFGMTQGIAPEMFMKVIPDCAGTSWMLENRAPHIVAGNYTPHSALDIWPKDLGIVLDAARAAKFAAPLTAAALQQFIAASGMGLGRQDDAAVAKLYARNAGLTLPGEG